MTNGKNSSEQQYDLCVVYIYVCATYIIRYKQYISLVKNRMSGSRISRRLKRNEQEQKTLVMEMQKQ